MNETMIDAFDAMDADELPLADAASAGARRPDGAPGHAWRVVSDRVMGGVSVGTARVEIVAGRRALRLTGRVSLENDGGFLQIARDFAADSGPVDLSAHSGLVLDLCGRGCAYGVHLRTGDLERPWQSYRAIVEPDAAWRRFRLPFADFAPHRTDIPFDPRRLRRIGIVAIGRAFEADVALARLALYREP